MRPSTLLLFSAIATTSAFAQGKHDHHSEHKHEHDAHEKAGLGTHVHGEAELMLALEGQQLQLQLSSPAANLLGFEHAPRTKEQRQVLAELTKTLAIPGALFTLPTAAHCELTGHQIESSLLETAHEHDQHEHDQHQHDQETHADFDISWTFDCAHPDKLDSLNAELFKRFSALEKIAAQWISDSGQGGATLTPAQSRLNFN